MAILTFTSDIGDKDYLPGAIKGKILGSISGVQIVDITHHLPAFHFAQCAYLCKSAFNHFPPGSIHLIFANVFDSKDLEIVLTQYNNQWLIGSNNGLLPMILDDENNKVIKLRLPNKSDFSIMDTVSVVIEALKSLLAGEAAESLGEATTWTKKPELAPQIGDNWIEGQILYIDRFENVVANIPKKLFEEQRNGRSFSIVFKRDEIIDTISNTYADVSPGQKLALFNAAGYLEIAVNKGNAAGLFGLQGYAENQYLSNRIFYQTIRVYFQ
jgi:S-adenosylmethionine hydrolase